MASFLAQGVDAALEATGMDAVDALRTFFLLAAATTISVSIPSSLRSRFLVYGPRATSTDSKPQSRASAEGASISRPLDYLATWRYFGPSNLLCRGTLFEAIASRVNEEHRVQTMSLTQVLVCWILLAMQGSRRLWESTSFAKPSTSKMWFVHWLLGLAFYLAAGIAIWIEGSEALMNFNLTLDYIKITRAPSLRTFLCVPLFLMASGMQHDCHHFLFSLKKYTLPDHPIFRAVVCPHYGAECVIYLSLAFLGAPRGQSVNKTLLACSAFVAVNLGLTARTTKQWYLEKFGGDKDDLEQIKSRWLMIPYIY
ncbi:hypothetical protein N7509_002558 [Penicillium cosmopolitanum]|uniref:Polyprenal reductase n=1 Tax=Penicillium cosmopolitanum TaxID=1131564 RepID=A0A9X0BDK3_9EURO|nr:uncharacterized protein N7509_002558 [Penicillium cosmopolitanum]KAJ5408675.1 hypothetical protein N7509_002558 [Penicillium cosmopolitanum]